MDPDCGIRYLFIFHSFSFIILIGENSFLTRKGFRQVFLSLLSEPVIENLWILLVQRSIGGFHESFFSFHLYWALNILHNPIWIELWLFEFQMMMNRCFEMVEEEEWMSKRVRVDEGLKIHHQTKAN